jgi:hypothetical protein
MSSMEWNFVRNPGNCRCKNHSVLKKSNSAYDLFKVRREEELTSETRKMVDAKANRIGITSRAGGYVSSPCSGIAAPPAGAVGDSARFSESFGTLFDGERVSRVSSILL